MKDVGIVGGGIIGLCTAWYLQEAGCTVTIIDKGNGQEGCSFGNAGMIVPSHIIPLATPGMIAKGIGWLFDSKSPFYIKPGLNKELLNWGWRFYRSATDENVKKAIPHLRDINLLSRSLYKELSEKPELDFELHERGLLMLYKTAKTEREEVEAAEVANHAGVKAEVLSPAQVQAMEPDMAVNVRGGIYFPGDAHLVPRSFMNALQRALVKKGVRFVSDQTVEAFETAHQRVQKVITAKEAFAFDAVVVAGGAWSAALVKKLRVNLPMQGGKGYSFMLPDWGNRLRIPSLLLDHRVAITPMNSELRLGGTMEIGGLEAKINLNRVKGIAEAVPHYYPELKVEVPAIQQIWHGFRPCSPDGLPYIGQLTHFENVVVATGHGMMGLSLAPATGKLVSELVLQQPASMNLEAFHPERFD
jgi:D-amino-acid dehydrogenase